jgi:uncharacterized NAD(P)/FAD-binding protein YdhS
VNLLRDAGPKAILIERSAHIARGVAYSAPDPALLLNVRAANMSALPDRPDHFIDWLAQRGVASDGFAPRALYGEYLTELLEDSRQTDPSRLEIVSGDAIAAEVGDAVRVRLASGEVVTGDTLVLASGNLPPVAPPNLNPDGLAPGRYVADPWHGDLAGGLGADDTVLILGTGLTMIDAALLLDRRGFRGRIVALSRRGLLPHRHAPLPAPPGLAERPPVEVTRLLRTVRKRAAAIGWRSAVDELRPWTRSLWLAGTVPQRARFLRHLRPWWDIHRHRIAPRVAEQIDSLRAEGRLRIVAGRLLGATDRVLTWCPRGADHVEEMLVDRIVNCTGPQVDLDSCTEPLLRSLRDAGHITPDPLRLGVATDPVARAIDVSGRPGERLFALGPLTKGTFWEMTAVPDIREQAWTLARRLSHAQWVGGEGL